MKFIASLQLVIMLSLTACAGGGSSGGSAGNESGSSPINATEETNYKRAISKCYKTGGSRVVKVEGRLLCY